MDQLNQEIELFSCPHCGFKCKKFGLASHIWRMHTDEGKNFDPNKGYKEGTRHCWSKGLKKENNDKLKQISNTYKENYKNGKFSNYMIGRHHSQEIKDRISKSRTRYLKEHPNTHPYIKYHNSKRQSYAETYFDEVFAKEGIKLEKWRHVGFYELDYCDVNKKIYIEVDGEHHYFDERIKEGDIRRTKYLEELGWKGFRIRWSDYQKMTFEEKNQIIEHIKHILNLTEEELNNYKEYIKNKYGSDYNKLYDDTKHKKELNKCLMCNNLTTKMYFCNNRSCYSKGQHLIGDNFNIHLINYNIPS